MVTVPYTLTRVGVLMTLEKSEESDPVVVEGVVGAVLDRGDPADGSSISQCEEELAIGGLVERILRVERVADGDAQRRNPLRVVVPVIDLPREIYKPAQIARGLD